MQKLLIPYDMMSPEVMVLLTGPAKNQRLKKFPDVWI